MSLKIMLIIEIFLLDTCSWSGYRSQNEEIKKQRLPKTNFHSGEFSAPSVSRRSTTDFPLFG